VAPILNRIPFWISLMALVAMVVELGFDLDAGVEGLLVNLYVAAMVIGVASTAGRHIVSKNLTGSR
jgi:hypothetical protein